LLAAFASLVIKEARNSNEVSKPESDLEENNESLPLNLIQEEDAAEEVEAYPPVGHAEPEGLDPERE
jgi:hypothetical protein